MTVRMAEGWAISGGATSVKPPSPTSLNPRAFAPPIGPGPAGANSL